MNHTKYWLWLTMVFGVGSRRIWEAMRFFETAAEAYKELCSGTLNARLTPDEISNINNTGLEKAEALIEEYSKKGICMAGCSDSEYPAKLRHILNPPAVIYYSGNISCLSGARTVTAVGARQASDYSIGAASKICGELAAKGVVIVSGFAVGIDITAHLAAASNNRPTVCVLGCGVDVDYPKENTRHRDLILQNGGVFISEFPPGTSPYPGNFPKRNRILAALGNVVIVFEAAIKSGSLITAGIAAELGKDVFCLPPADIFSGRFAGNIAFLRDGAYPLYSSADVMDCFRIGGSNDMLNRSEMLTDISKFGVGELKYAPKKRTNSGKTKNKPEKTNKDKKIDIEKHTPSVPDGNAPADADAELVSQKPVLEGFNSIQEKIIDLLKEENQLVDVISARLGMNADDVMLELMELELTGAVESLPGNIYKISDQLKT